MTFLADPMWVASRPAQWRDGWLALLLVGAVHMAVLFGVSVGLRQPTPDDFKPPTLSGVLVAEASQQITPPLPAPKPPPKHAPVVQHKPPPAPVAAPPTERSITVPKAEPQEKPLLAPADAPATQTPAQPAIPSHTTVTEPAAAPPVVPPLADASHLNNPAPAYPMGARRRNEQGVVYLTVLVLTDGTVGDLSLKRSSGYPELDESALKAVARWHFVPANRAGKPIDWRYTLPVSFSLNP